MFCFRLKGWVTKNNEKKNRLKPIYKKTKTHRKLSFFLNIFKYSLARSHLKIKITYFKGFLAEKNSHND